MKLTARAFYDDITTRGDNQPKSGRTDNKGLAVVVLDALTRYSNFWTLYDTHLWILECKLLGFVKLDNELEIGSWECSF